jgi:hypothetical protein
MAPTYFVKSTLLPTKGGMAHKMRRGRLAAGRKTPPVGRAQGTRYSPLYGVQSAPPLGVYRDRPFHVVPTLRVSAMDCPASHPLLGPGIPPSLDKSSCLVPGHEAARANGTAPKGDQNRRGLPTRFPRTRTSVADEAVRSNCAPRYVAHKLRPASMLPVFARPRAHVVVASARRPPRGLRRKRQTVRPPSGRGTRHGYVTAVKMAELTCRMTAFAKELVATEFLLPSCDVICANTKMATRRRGRRDLRRGVCSEVTSPAPSRFSPILVCPHMKVQTPGRAPCFGRMTSPDPCGMGASDPPSCHVISGSDGPLVYPFMG